MWDLDPISRDLAAILRAAFEHAAEPFAALDVEGRFLFSNLAFGRLTGFEGAELVGCPPPHPFWDPGSTFETYSKMQLLLSEDWERLGVHSIEARLRRADGQLLDTVFVGGALRQRGSLAGHGGFVLDVRGRSWEDLSRAVAVALRQLGSEERVRVAVPRGPAGEASLLRRSGITAREREVLLHLLEGYRVRSIAGRLGLSEYTVRNHLKSLFRKTGASSQVELIEHFRRRREEPV